MADIIEDTQEDIDAARRQGWRPESEWDEERAEKEGRRKPKEFISAREYLERGEKRIPILNDQLHRVQAELDEVKKDRLEGTKRLDEMHQILTDQQRMTKEAVKRARENGRKEAEEAIDKAVVDGDTKAAQDARAKLTEIHNQELEDAKATTAPKTKETETATATGVKVDPTPPAVINAWMRANPWFGDHDRKLRLVMEENHKAVLLDPDFKDVDPMEKLEEAARRTRQDMPAHFGKEDPDEEPPRRTATVSRPSYVRGARDTPESRFAALPPEDKAAYERTKKRMKADRNFDYTIKAFMEDYE